MNKKKNKHRKVYTSLLIAFIANLVFAITEFAGGVLSKSTAIIADAFHDSIDVLILLVALILEKKSDNKTDKKYTYGYKRYSIISAFIMGLLLIGGSGLIMYHSILKLIHYKALSINGEYMAITACIGLFFNGVAFLATMRKKGLNESAVHLHMLEDWFGLIIVLLGSIFIMQYKIYIIDPILSMLASIYIIIHATLHLKHTTNILLEKKPSSFDSDKYFEHIKNIKGVIGIHHFHIWQLNETYYLATMHVNILDNIKNEEIKLIRKEIENINKKFLISHDTVEFEYGKLECENATCEIKDQKYHHHHH